LTSSNKSFLILEGVASTFYLLLTQGAVFTGLAIAFGLDEFLIGVAYSFPMMAQVFQIFSPIIVERFPKRRFLVNFFNIVSRTPWLILALLLLFNLRQPRLFLLIFAVSQVIGAFAANVWTSWARDLIPQSERGSFFAKRSFYISLANLIVLYLYSLMIDHVGDPYGYFIVVCIGMLGTLLSVLSLNKVDEVSLKSSGVLAEIRAVFRDYNFMRLSVFYFVWNTVVVTASPFFTYHLLKNVAVPFSYIGLTSILSSLIAMIFYIVWGRMSDVCGHKVVAVLGIILASFTPPLWLFMNQTTWKYLMIVDAFMAGISWSAINLTFLTLPMEVAVSSSPTYFAMYSAFGGLGGLVGALSGGLLAKTLSGINFYLFGMPVLGIQILFFAQGLMRIATLPLLNKVSIRRHTPLRYLILNTASYLVRRSPLRPYEYSKAGIINQVKRSLSEMKIDTNKRRANQWRVKRWW